MVPHKWMKSSLGHGNLMCERCKITDLEAAALGQSNDCDNPPAHHTIEFYTNKTNGRAIAVCSCGWEQDGLLEEVQAAAASHDLTKEVKPMPPTELLKELEDLVAKANPEDRSAPLAPVLLIGTLVVKEWQTIRAALGNLK